MPVRKFIREALPLRNRNRNRNHADELQPPQLTGESPRPQLIPPVDESSSSQALQPTGDRDGSWRKVDGEPAKGNSSELSENPPKLHTRVTAPPEPRLSPEYPFRRYNSAPNFAAYDYTKLPDLESLRVLELLPGVGDEPIVCKLHVTDWNDPMPFDAVSYAWGDPKILASIICNQKKLDVTPNLVDCLHQLRRPNESRYLWADAACINQRDLEERGHQVDNMRRIYECAQKLLIWLGKDDGGYASSVEAAMKGLAKKCCEAKEQDIDELYEIDNLWETVALPPYKVGMSLESWQAIEKLFLCSWFSRLWVFQEVVSVTHADVYWGEMVISWDIIGLTATYIQSWSHVIEHKYLQSGVYNCYTMRNRNNHSKFSVPSILDWSRTFRCSLSLDRIYAMLGFPSFHRNGFSIQADYKRTQAELFIEVANQCMKADNNLQILSYTDHTRKSHLNKPSWVPQWDPGSPGWTIGYKRTTWTWSATKGKKMDVEINFEKELLLARGIQLDVVKESKQVNNAKWYPYNPTREHPITQLWKDAYASEWTYPSGERFIDVFGGCLVAGIPSNECACCTRQEIVRKDFAAYITRCAEESGEDTNEAVWVEAYHKGSRGDWKGYEQNGMNFCYGRSFFTMEGGYMGLGPNTLEEKDVIVLLYGGDVPYVLRPREEGGYVLVGEAYVHGCMLGEVVPKIDAGEYEEKIWEIY